MGSSRHAEKEIQFDEAGHRLRLLVSLIWVLVRDHPIFKESPELASKVENIVESVKELDKALTQYKAQWEIENKSKDIGE